MMFILKFRSAQLRSDADIPHGIYFVIAEGKRQDLGSGTLAHSISG